MASKDISINDSNIYEWLCSTGHLLPGNEKELNRFERLFPGDEIVVNENAVDPFVIISGNRKKQSFVSTFLEPDAANEMEQLRMAARKHRENLPSHIIDQIQKNHQKGNGEPDNTQG